MPTWTSNIPSQVKTFADLSAFPITGSVKTIYIAEDTDIAYYWTGSAYAPISIQDLSGLFPNPTGNTTQYIRGDGSLETFPTIPDVSGLVPYTGANANVDLGEFGVEAGFLEFDTTPTNTPTTQGTLSWDVDDETLQLVMNGSVLKIGEDQYYPVKNQTGVSIPKGTAVRFAGTVGGSGRLLIAPYIADGSVPNSVFMGVTAETIDNGDDGKVMWFGRIRGINTNAFEEGDILYASPTTAGGFTTVPNNKVQVCAVITKSINNGTIFVRPSIFPTTPRLQSVTSSATVTPTSGNDIVIITAQAEGLTLANPTGTFAEGQSLIIRIKDNGTARTIGYGADYRAIGVTLPTTTVINKTTYLGCIYNATDSKLDIVGVCTEV